MRTIMFKLEIYEYIYVQIGVFQYKSFQVQAEFCNYIEIQEFTGEISDFNFKI